LRVLAIVVAFSAVPERVVVGVLVLVLNTIEVLVKSTVVEKVVERHRPVVLHGSSLTASATPT
jgi:hypothetical protein